MYTQWTQHAFDPRLTHPLDLANQQTTSPVLLYILHAVYDGAA